jgi:hypothetical protein
MVALDLPTDGGIIHAHLIHNGGLLRHSGLVELIVHLLGNHAIDHAVHLLHLQLQLIALLLDLLY